MRLPLVLLLLSAPLLAKPPSQSSVTRMDDLDVQLTDLLDKLQKQEAFASKPREERMILRYMAGDKEFEGRKLTGQTLAKAILEDWKAVQKPLEEVTADETRILELLASALGQRFGKAAPPPIPKKPRYNASKVLLKALKSRHDTIRKAGIDALHAIYDQRLLYRYDASSGARREKIARWSREIERRKR